MDPSKKKPENKLKFMKAACQNSLDKSLKKYEEMKNMGLDNKSTSNRLRENLLKLKGDGPSVGLVLQKDDD